MSAGRSRRGPEQRLKDISGQYPKEKAIAIISDMLKDEYKKLDGAMRKARESYLKVNVDDPARQNEIADMRLDAVESYRPAFAIESFLAGMGVDPGALMPGYKGDFELSYAGNDGWDLSVVSLKENAMRALGGHCNVIGDIIVLERLLYDHTYLATVLKLTDDYEPGKQSYVEFDYYTVVFDEDIQSIVKVPLRGR